MDKVITDIASFLEGQAPSLMQAMPMIVLVTAVAIAAIIVLYIIFRIVRHFKKKSNAQR